MTSWYRSVHDLLVQPYAEMVDSLCKQKSVQEILLVFDECTELDFDLCNKEPVGGLDKRSLIVCMGSRNEK